MLLISPICGLAMPLTESQSLEFGLNRPDFLQLHSSRVEQARGDLTRRKTWVNPELELSREELRDDTETAIWLRQRLDLSGRRGLQRDAARAALSAELAKSASARLERAAEIRQQFFQTLYQQQQRELFVHWVEKFTAVEAAMFKREASGDVSGYDRRRISREKVSLLALARESEAAYRAAWLQLSGLLGTELRPRVSMRSKVH